MFSLRPSGRSVEKNLILGGNESALEDVIQGGERIEPPGVMWVETLHTLPGAGLLKESAGKYDPKAAFAHYYRGLVLTKMGRGERALMSFKEALVAELHRDVPDGMNLRLFRDKIREIESLNSETARASTTRAGSPPSSA